MINRTLAQRYCCEDISLIANYNNAVADTTCTWQCHHRNAIIMNCSADELKAQGLYENRPAHELIFLTPGEHSRLHNAGKQMTAETRAKMSSVRKGKTLSAKHRAKIRAALNRPEARAKMSAAKKGNKNALGHTHTAEVRQKISDAQKGRHWFNNGVECKCCKECPGEGWKRGRK